MSDAPDKPITPRHAWQPLTPRGVAAFAYASFTRLFVVEFVVAFAVAAVLAWVVATCYMPVLRDATKAAPPGAMIRGGQLVLPAGTVETLAGNASIEIAIDTRGIGARGGGAAEITVSLRQSNALVCGYLGCAMVPYPANYTIALSASEVGPWWSAWRKLVVAAFFAAIIFLQMFAWSVVASIFAVPIRMVAFFSDLVVSVGGTWRLVSAAMLPGCCIICLGLVLYGQGVIDVLRLALVMGLYFPCSVFFIVTSLIFLGRLAKQKGNPFSRGEGPAGPEKKQEENPFLPR